MKVIMPVKSYKKDLLIRLKNKNYASQYLQCSFEECKQDNSWEVFGLALKNVIEANHNIKGFAKNANISRQHLYKLFSKTSNPTIASLLRILNILGLTLDISSSKQKSFKKTAA